MLSIYLALAPLLAPAPQQGSPHQVARHGFLLLGQSNMQGRTCAESLPPALQVVQRDVHIFNRTNCTNAPSPPAYWDQLHAGVNSNNCLPDKFGTELGIGVELEERLQDDIYLIKYAVDGSRLASPAVAGTSPSYSWHPRNTGSQPGVLLDRTVAHCEQAVLGVPLLNIEGIFWVQGIRDLLSLQNSEDYEENLEAFIIDLRQELFLKGLTRRLNVPFVISMVPEFIIRPGNTYPDVVRCAQQAVALRLPNVFVHDPYTAMSIVKGPACNQQYKETIHFDTPSQVQHGRDLVAAYFERKLPSFTRDSCSALLEDSNGSIQFEYRFPPALAGMQYYIVGSAAGPLPILGLDASSLAPATYYFGNANMGSPGACGILDNSGSLRLQTTFRLPPPGQTQALYGRLLHHVLYVLNNQTILAISNPVSLYIHP